MHRAVQGAVHWTAATATCAAILTLPYASAVPATAAAACRATPTPAPTVSDPAAVPWAVAASGVDGLVGVADGAGETVAVIDSGVSPLKTFGHRVLRGHDLLGSTDGRTDCVGHGTAVASIIAAAPTNGIGFRGLAPAAKILPVRVTEAELVGNEASGDATTAAGLGNAITWTVDHGADVLNISVVVGTDDRTLRLAVARAIDKGVVVVASVGNSHNDSGPDPTPYPADYPGVIGVGSIDSTGERSSTSEVGDFLDVVAPGGGVTADRLPSGLGRLRWDELRRAVRRRDRRTHPARVSRARTGSGRRPHLRHDRPAADRRQSRGLRTWDRRSVSSGRWRTARHSMSPHPQPSPTTSPPHVAGGPVDRAATGIENPGRQRSIVAVTVAIALIMLAFGWTLTAAHRRRLDGQP